MSDHPPAPPSTLDLETAHRFRSHVSATLLALDLLESADAATRRKAMSVVRRHAQAVSDLVDELSGTVRNPTPTPDGAPISIPAGTRVLVVEDEYLLAQTVAEHLQKAGCLVVGPVATIEEGVNLAHNGLVHCAVVDANLDGSFSTPILDALAARGVPAAVLGGYDHAAMPSAFRKWPFLQKPVDPASLQDIVGALCTSGNPITTKE